MASFYILLLLIPLFFFLKYKSKFNSLKRNYKLPPGPSAIPIIGSLHHFIGAGLPHHALHKLALQYGDLMFLKLGEHPTIVVSSGEVAREVLKTHDLTFSDRYIDLTPSILFYGGQDVAFSPYNEHWREVRKICIMELLSPKQVRSFRSIRECEVGNFIKHVSLLSSKGQIVDLSEELMALQNNVFLQAIMGVKFKDQKPVLDEVLNLFEVSAGFNLANLLPSSRIARLISGAVSKAEECHRAFDQLLDTLIRERKDQHGVDGEVEDLLAVLLRLHYENNSISMDAVKAIVLDLITAGTDTCAATLDWAMAELMRHPEVMKKAQTQVRQQFQGREHITESDLALAELSFMQDIIKETLRFHPPAPIIQRKSQEVSTIKGYEIPKGMNVLIHPWAIGRDSKFWKDADEFRPERFAGINADMHFKGMNFELLPFGSGRRMCPALTFATVNLELVLANLLFHFNWELPPGMTPHQMDMTESFGLTLRRKPHLLLHAQPYHHACT